MRLTRALSALVLLVTGCGDPPSVPVPGNGALFIIIHGLPSGVDASVNVSGPDGFDLAASSSRRLSGLRPGTYTITALEVADFGSRYAPNLATQTITVTSGELTEAEEITYDVSTARLALDVLGLPAGAQAGVVVSGPGGFSRAITGTTTLDQLAPGTYSLAATDVNAASTVYRPDPSTLTVTLAADTTPAQATIGYGAGSGTIDIAIAGLPQNTPASVTITGPGNYARSVTASTSLRYLDGGSYSVTVATAGSNLTTYTSAVASQTVAVSDGASSALSVSYTGSPLELSLELVSDGFAAPVFLTAPYDDPRLFVVERNGRIRVVENGSVLSTPFLDIASRVNFTGERGMLSMAFDPHYAQNGRFYVYYVDPAGSVVVERFSSTPGSNVAGPSDGIVLNIPHGGNEHHGGMIAFGPDGMLYLAPGDGRCCGDPDENAQSFTSRLGKVLRIDVRTLPYTIPEDNPIARNEIWALGLRNPWRFSFDPSTGLLYIADVGQDVREEVNVVASRESGLNFGWPLMEASACFNPATNCASGATLTLPVHEYTHADGCSVTGGYVYRGSAIPELSGHYLYSDFCAGWLRSFRVAGGAATDHREWAGVSLPWTVSFGRDGFGELYMIGGTRVWRIRRDAT